jgi:hypothetical protein
LRKSSNASPVGEPVSFEKPQLSAFIAGQAESPRDLIPHEEELADGWQASRGLNLVKAYDEGGIYLVIRFVTERSPRKYDLIFRAIGVLQASSDSERDVKGVTPDSRMRHVRVYGNECGMSRVAQSVESPEGLIPTLVRLEGAKNRYDFIGHVSADFVSDNGVFELGDVVSDREHCLFRFDLSRRNSGSVSGLIKCRAKVDEGVKGDITPFDWDGFNESDFVKLVNSIRIRIDEKVVWATIEESSDLLVKLGNVLMCSDEPPLRAEEWMVGFKESSRHG